MFLVDTSRAEIKEFFENRFREWRGKQPTMKATQAQFAEWLGITLDTLNGYIRRGATPGGDNLANVGKHYPEVYSLLGITPPDPLLRSITEHSSELTDEEKRAILSEIDKMLAKRREGTDNGLVRKPAT